MGGLLFRFARALLDAATASAIIDRIRSRCPELTRADLLLVARVLADCQRAKDDLAPSRKQSGSRAPKAALDARRPLERGGLGECRQGPVGLALLGVVRALDALALREGPNCTRALTPA
jgi:hypothetical protein